jgi:hypothetical protein
VPFYIGTACIFHNYVIDTEGTENSDEEDYYYSSSEDDDVDHLEEYDAVRYRDRITQML